MFRAAVHVVISDFFHLRLGASVCGGGGGGGGGGQQASSLSSKHKLWNFHRFWLVLINFLCENQGGGKVKACILKSGRPWPPTP